MAWVDDGGRTVVESVTKPGVRWVAAFVAAAPGVVNAAVVNTRNGRGFADELERLWGEDDEPRPVLRVSQADAVAAAGAWLSGVEETGLVLFRPADVKVALASVDLPVGGSWISRNGEPITAVQAHTMALWASDHAPAEDAGGGFWVYCWGWG